MFEEVPSLSVFSFFNIKTDLFYAKKALEVTDKKYLLISSAPFLSEEKFCDVYMGYNHHAIYFHVRIDKPFEEVNSADFQKGDSVEFFIDTRDIKDKTIVSQFCHHFVFFAEAINGILGKEITRFRTDEVHPLCNPKDLKVTTHFSKKSYILDIEIKSGALFAYDPSSFDRLGFTYRINRKGGAPQHFALSSSEYKIEQQPSLWASLAFRK